MRRTRKEKKFPGFRSRVFLFGLLLCLFEMNSGCNRLSEPEVEVNASLAPSATPARIKTFTKGVCLHNGYLNFVRDEFKLNSAEGVIQFHPRKNGLPRAELLMAPPDDRPFPARALAVQETREGHFLWVGSLFEGLYGLRLPEGEVKVHYTVESTGIPGRAVSLSENRLRFHPDRALSPAEIEGLSERVLGGLYLRFNTEVFQVKAVRWPEFEVYTYGSHDLVHAGASEPPLNRVILMTGLTSNTINDLLVHGDTLWIAAGLPADKGLAGGVFCLREGVFSGRFPDAVLNERHRFHWQQSNAALSLARVRGRLWSGWAEIRGLKPWGGVSGGLISFAGSGADRKSWRNLVRQAGVNAEGYAPVFHVSVSSLEPVELKTGNTLEQCIAAGTFNINEPRQGMGWPGRHAWGGSGLRVVCDWRLRAIIYKTYGKDGKPSPGSPPSNAVFSVDTLKDPEGRPWVLAGTDAGLFLAELSSQWREYFYQEPENPRPTLKIGSLYLLGENRSGEVLHGMTVGGESWPACLPDLYVQEALAEDLGEGQVNLWAATYRGLALYSGLFQEEKIKDCANWTWFLFYRRGDKIEVRQEKPRPPFPPSPSDSEPGIEQENPPIPVSRILRLPEFAGGGYALGTGYVGLLFASGKGLLRLLEEAKEQPAGLPDPPITHVRLLYSTVYENNQESLIFPDATAINLYTLAFHKSPCHISEPQCLAGDTLLNYRRLDAMIDRILASGLKPTFCISTFPYLMYRDFVKKPGPCSPPNPDNPECAPSRTKWDFTRWENLLFALVEHFYSRYGREAVAEWGLEIWNEPAVHWLWPWEETWPEDYALLMLHAKKALAAVNAYWDEKDPETRGKSVILMGPAFHGDPFPPDERFRKALSALKSRDALPEVLTLHLYPFATMDMSAFYKPALKFMREEEVNLPVAVTEYGPVMAQSHDGIGTLAASSLPALFLFSSLPGLYQSGNPPRMMYALETQFLQAGTGSNWPGLVGYLGAAAVAPRPFFNALRLAASAGEEILPVKVSGGISALAAREHESAALMLFISRTRVRKPWKETIHYAAPAGGWLKVKLKVPRGARYRTVEWRIDRDHANYLTALWAAGSPDSPGPEQVKRIKEKARLMPLPQEEKSFPAFVRGPEIEGKVFLPADGIYALRLEPAREAP